MGATISIIFMILTLLTLISGVIIMVIGGEINRKYSNKLMQMRVLLQALAITSLFLIYSNK